jgi:hypothetical protein
MGDPRKDGWKTQLNKYFTNFKEASISLFFISFQPVCPGGALIFRYYNVEEAGSWKEVGTALQWYKAVIKPFKPHGNSIETSIKPPPNSVQVPSSLLCESPH